MLNNKRKCVIHEISFIKHFEKFTSYEYLKEYFTPHKSKRVNSNFTLPCLSVKLMYHIIILILITWQVWTFWKTQLIATLPSTTVSPCNSEQLTEWFHSLKIGLKRTLHSVLFYFRRMASRCELCDWWLYFIHQMDFKFIIPSDQQFQLLQQ